MDILSVSIDKLQYRRPGLSKISFTVSYRLYKRRGIIVYDTVKKQFLSHNSDLNLLAVVCQSLSRSSIKEK